MSKKYAKYNNYDLSPYKKIVGFEEQAFDGYESILKELKGQIANGKRVIVCDFYPGVNKEEILRHFIELEPTLIIDAEDCLHDENTLNEMFYDNLTEDRVFGIMSHKNLEDCYIEEKIKEAKQKIEDSKQGTILVIGVGASIITKGDLFLYFDMARWEIQLRYRKGMPNFNCTNNDAPILSKYKRGFFIEWRIADRYKKRHFKEFNYVVDSNKEESPKMITGEAFTEGLIQVSKQPFRLQPYFDPGVWGGQWMKDVFSLDDKKENYAWSFDGVPEENSLFLKYGEVTVELPCMDLVLFRPKQLLGEKVHARFGAEFPIRFDLLDTMDGGNLSLQVHPLTEYIQDTFGMHYTQDESYYILDAAKEDTYVYLGVKEDIDKNAMREDLESAKDGQIEFPCEEYINKIPVKKHDHILIPAGTIHCSGKNTMVLEISATPYIFTFKLWDWARVGLDGLPRPIHLEHGWENIQWDRDTNWVMDNLVHQEQICKQEEGLLIEKTGLHEREFIETIRYTFMKPVICDTNDSVNVLNLVEGKEAIIESPTGEFEPFHVHYAETFIIPASVKTYTMRPVCESDKEELSIITAFVR